jgi:hypothetical protein
MNPGAPAPVRLLFLVSHDGQWVRGSLASLRVQFALRLWQSAAGMQALAVRGRGLERGEV